MSGGSKRLKNLQICRPFVYGNMAVPLKEDRSPEIPTDHTHSWTVFLKGVNGDDLSSFVKRVVFKLHETYANSTRSIEEPPFEVTETGWGEFEISIRVYFVPEASEKNVVMYHHLKLHPYGPEAEQQKTNGATVTSMQYDEFVFNEPTESLFEILTKKPGAVLPAQKSMLVPFSVESENEELDRLSDAHAKVQANIRRLTERIHVLEQENSALQSL
ncbi:yeats family-domain-containing protein [Lipomyces orientalis]|uniref:Yeats family-domain-containing protein n=1 Tax=Lipomyces orientalis TaxID=1233043 RepID=A0ACC3TUK2_9ASCO